MSELELCPCKSSKKFKDCCHKIITGEIKAETAEELMRSRYTAYSIKDFVYILKSTHISQKSFYSIDSIKNWAENLIWINLEIISTQKGTKIDLIGEVEFKVSYLENNQEKLHHELSFFKKEEGIWYFVSGQEPRKNQENTSIKIGRNEPCTCGSGKKYKKCCAKN
ncbi:MAG: YchJ family protein [Candidatus Sericytochromatia bacterium]